MAPRRETTSLPPLAYVPTAHPRIRTAPYRGMRAGSPSRYPVFGVAPQPANTHHTSTTQIGREDPRQEGQDIQHQAPGDTGPGEADEAPQQEDRLSSEGQGSGGVWDGAEKKRRYVQAGGEGGLAGRRSVEGPRMLTAAAAATGGGGGEGVVTVEEVEAVMGRIELAGRRAAVETAEAEVKKRRESAGGRVRRMSERVKRALSFGA